MRALWKIFDLIAPSGAARRVLRMKLGDDFHEVERFLKPIGIAETIPDNLHVLELEELENGNFLAHSPETPPHRAPFEIERSEAVILGPDISKLRDILACQFGFVPHTHAQSPLKQFVELGSHTLDGGQFEPVYLYVAGERPRGLELLEGFNTLHASRILLSTNSHLDYGLRELAAKRNLRLHILSTDAELARVKLKPGRKAGKIAQSSRLIPEIPNAKWQHLEVTIGKDGIGYAIGKRKGLTKWERMNLSVKDGRHIPRVFDIVVLVSEGHPCSTKNEKVRKAVSLASKKLRALFPIGGKPIVVSGSCYRLAFQLHVETKVRLLDRALLHEPDSIFLPYDESQPDLDEA